MVEARSVFANGLGLEGGMTSAMKSAKADGANQDNQYHLDFHF